MAILKRTDIYEGGKALTEVKKEIEEIIVLQKELQKATREVNATGSGAEAKERLKLTKQLTDANQKLIQAESKQAQEIALVKEATRQANAENRKLAKEKLKLVGAYERESKKLIELRKQYKDLAVQNKANTKESRALLSQITKLDTKLKKVDATVGQHQRNVGNYSNALKGVGRQLLGAAGIVGGVDLLIKGFTKLTERALELNKVTRQVSNTWDISKKQAKELSSSILAIANNFDKDFNEVLRAANAASKEFGITGERALALIEEGFKKGSDNSGEFLDIVREYPAQLQSVGLSAEESFAIINQQVRAGVYSDKGIDAIKEAGIALRENTKAVQDALAPLDKNVRLEIQREVAAGNTFKAMQLIASQLDDTNLTAAETQAIMSDVFKGAGEDALTFVKNLDELELSLEGVNEQTTEYENSQVQLSKTWNNFISGLFDDEGTIAKVWKVIIDYATTATYYIERLLKYVGIIDQEAKKLVKTEKELTVTRAAGTKNADERAEAEKKLAEEEEERRKKKKTDRSQYQNDLNYLDSYVKKLEEQRSAEIALLAAEIDRRNKIKELAGETPDVEGFGLEGADPISGLREQIDKENELRDEQRKRELEKTLEIEQAKKDIKQTFEQEATQFAINAASQIAEDKKNKELNRIEAEKDALKDQLDKGLINEIQYQTKLAELNKQARVEEAKAAKRQALYEIAIATAIAVAKSIPNLLRMARAAALGAVQAAFVAARPLPKFEKGGEIGGKRHSEGGTVIEAEKGEFVLNRQAYSNAPMLAEAINSGMIRDKDLGLKKGQKDNLILGMMIQGLRKDNKQVIELLSNMGYAIPKKDYIEERRSNGEIYKHIIK